MGQSSSKSPSKRYRDGELSIESPEPLKPSRSATTRRQRKDSDDSSKGFHRRSKSALAGTSSSYGLHPEDAPPSYGDAVFAGSGPHSSNHLAVPGGRQNTARGSNNPFLRTNGSSSSLSASHSGAATPPSLPGYTQSERERYEYLRRPLRQESYEDALTQLKKYDTILLVDDSGSMAYHGRWEEARRALSKLADLAARWDQDGLDIYFLNNETVLTNCKESNSVLRLFDAVQPDGITPIGEKLDTLLNDYLDQVDEAKKSKRQLPKPVNILVLTDGTPTDDPYSVIQHAAKRMDKAHYPLSQVGIQFVQIGNDKSATQYLRKLDDKLGSAENGIRDMVDTTPYIGEVSQDMLVKIMLGGINRRQDQKNNGVP
ncbi:hypothetical protein L226DRAFT_529278 [Lentinus tigrinus ALCF2SS1-7]|uniref:VWFA domain-containing protein n=1 Tax=Lentinus tigrinus ALCF2SS1-6 TaxID=1328759 RepID=A0A5C2SU01_9APHY|nr:hypothetical protein L227DRAFT_569091 [Lentinus tigrinus ALCF2SS1-6]RPD80823.1 hypothetical protein L226DRAFT_529278 [Lentinus tigrinus ALCF2SS1-7]